MFLEGTLYPESGRADQRDAANILGNVPIRLWPNDCKDCGARMEFVLQDENRATRNCPACGRITTATDVITAADCQPRS